MRSTYKFGVIKRGRWITSGLGRVDAVLAGEAGKG
jgi:hypothetical protein